MKAGAEYVQEFIEWVNKALEALEALDEWNPLPQVKALGDGMLDFVTGSVEETRKHGRVVIDMHGFGGRKTIGSGAPDDGIIVPYRIDQPTTKRDEGTWSGKPEKTSTSHPRSNNDAEREAQRLAEKIKSLTEKVQQSIASLAHDITNEVGTAYEKGMDALHQKMEQMQAQIAEASDLGIDTTALQAKLEEYANIVKEKVTKAWREANEDLRSETALTWAQVNKDVRAEAEATYQIGVTKLNREKENRLKEVALTKDSAEARVAVEQWRRLRRKLDRQRLEALRKSPQTTQEALRATLEEQYERLRDVGAQMKELTDSLFTSMADGFTSGFQNVLTDGFKGIQDAFSNNAEKHAERHCEIRDEPDDYALALDDYAGFRRHPCIAGKCGGAGLPCDRRPRLDGQGVHCRRARPEIFRPTQPGRILNSLSGGTSAAPSIRVIVNNNTNERMNGHGRDEI